MSKGHNFSQVTTALNACIAAAPEKERAALAQALENWGNTYRQSYIRATSDSAPTALSRLIITIEEATEARISVE